MNVGVPPEVSILIATLDATTNPCLGCLRLIRDHTREPHEVVIIDNGGAPQGYTRPVNAAARAASAPYLVLLNDDAYVTAGWWPPLRAALDMGATIAMPREAEGDDTDDGAFNTWCIALRRTGEPIFDESYRVNMADTKLCWQIDQAGQRRVCVAESRVRHLYRQTTTHPEHRAWTDPWMGADHALAATRSREGQL